MLKRLFAGLMLLLAISLRAVTAQPSIAVLDFSAGTDAQAKAALQIPVLLSDGLARSGKFIVVEREKLHSVMREQEFSAPGLSIRPPPSLWDTCWELNICWWEMWWTYLPRESNSTVTGFPRRW
jgi:hypothetical protein